MLAVHKILVPIIFRPSTERALALGRMIAGAWGASLHLVHVIAHPRAPPDVTAREQRHVCKRLGAMLNRSARARRHATTTCRIGTPAAEVVRYAAEHAIDLIVMTTHPHGPSMQMATGSITEAVLGTAPCAGLAVKARGTRPYETHRRATRETSDREADSREIPLVAQDADR